MGNSVLSIENLTNQFMNQQQLEQIDVHTLVHESINDSVDRIKVFDSIEAVNRNENAGLRLEEYSQIQNEYVKPVETADKLTVSEILFGLWVIGAEVVAVVFLITNLMFGKRVRTTRIYTNLCGNL